MIMQFTVSAESMASEQAAIQSGQQQGQPQMPEQPKLPGPTPTVQMGQGGGPPPESINPQTNPIGAAGGLPLGLSS